MRGSGREAMARALATGASLEVPIKSTETGVETSWTPSTERTAPMSWTVEFVITGRKKRGAETRGDGERERSLHRFLGESERAGAGEEREQEQSEE